MDPLLISNSIPLHVCEWESIGTPFKMYASNTTTSPDNSVLSNLPAYQQYRCKICWNTKTLLHRVNNVELPR